VEQIETQTWSKLYLGDEGCVVALPTRNQFHNSNGRTRDTCCFPGYRFTKHS